MSPSARAQAAPLRMRLLLLAASGLLPLVIVLAWGINHLVQAQRSAAKEAALELSSALATAVDAEVRSIQSLLVQMGTSDDLERADLRSFHLAARRSAQQLGWRDVSLADGDGHVLFHSNQPFDNFDSRLTDPASLAQVMRTGQAVVTDMVRSDTDGKPTFAVRVPVIRDGKVTYVLTAVLSTEVINKIFSWQAIPADSVAAVFDHAGERLARSRPLRVAGQASPSLRRLLASGDPQGTGVATTPEGEELYVGYTRLAQSGWVVTVGNSVAQSNRGLFTLLSAVALGLVASLALALLFAWLLSRHVIEPIHKLKEGAANLGRGAPVDIPPLHIVELDEVANALRAAARERDSARDQVDDALRLAREANRSKDQFLAILGHELRNPLAPIANAVQLMAMKGDERTAQERRIIERQLVHVTRLVDDLLDISRITSGRLALNRKPVRMAHVLEQAIDTIQPSLQQRKLALDMEPAVRDAWVDGDEVRLVQVFNNLLVNAIKFTSADGAIHVQARLDGAEVEVQVQDSGVGIAPDEIGHIFELFYQSPQSVDRSRGGLGLGLPIVKSLVEMHGGSVRGASAGPGQGTCLSVRLPVCQPPVAAPAADVLAPAERGNSRVLVVDDNEDAADTCATLLEMAGYEVRVAYTPQAALDAAEQFHPDVAILDIGLPGMSGYELARTLRHRGYAGRLAALTGYGQATDMAASRAAGFDAHLTKPVAPQALLALVAKFAAESV